MKKSRYSDKQIIGMLKQHEAGVKTSELCRKHGISAATFYGWKSKFGGRNVKEAQRLKQMEDENRRLKPLVAELNLNGEALKPDMKMVASDLMHDNKYPAELPNELLERFPEPVWKSRPFIYQYGLIYASFPAQSSATKNLEQAVTARYLLDHRRRHQELFCSEFDEKGLRFFHDKFIPKEDVNGFTKAFDELVTLGCSRVTLASELYCFCQSYPGSSEPDMYTVPFPTQKTINKYVATLRDAKKIIKILRSYKTMDELAQSAGYKEKPQGYDDIDNVLEWCIGALSKWYRPRKDIVKSYSPIALCMYAMISTGKWQFANVSILLQCFGYKPDPKRRKQAKGFGLGNDDYAESLERNFRNFKTAHPIFCQQLELSMAGDELLIELFRSAEYYRWFNDENISIEYSKTKEACDKFAERFNSYLKERVYKQFNWTNIFLSPLSARMPNCYTS